MALHRTMVAIVMCWTCLQISGVIGQQSSTGTYSRAEVDQLVADVTRTARQETEQLRSTLGDVIHRQNAINEKLQADNDIIKQHIDEQKALNERLELENIVIKQENVAIKQQYESTTEILEGNIALLKEEIGGIIAAVPKRDGNESHQIVFSVASHQDFGPVPTHTNVLYEDVKVNIGGGWFPLADAFQAPMDGVYMFTASMLSHPDSNEDVHCFIVHSSQETGQIIVASMWGDRNFNDGDANSVILELSEGDIVSVQLEAGDRVITSNSNAVYSTFTGFLLFA